MAVYVDDAHLKANVSYRGHKIRDTWCHLTADSREELDLFASHIGLNPRWIQYPGTWKEHYDLTSGRRAKAVAAGAIEVNWKNHTKNFLLPRKNKV